MTVTSMIKKELLKEISILQQRIRELEHSESERRRADETLQRAHDELEQRVADRTQELMRLNEELLTEIAERKQMEKTLSSEHQKLSSILDGSPVSSYVIDSNHHVIAWNVTNEFFTGISKEEVLGKPLDLSSLFKDKIRPILADLVLEMTDEEIIRRYAHKGIRKSNIHPEAFESTSPIWIKGKKHIMAIQATRLRDAAGNVIGAIQCGQDITEQRQAEEEQMKVHKLESVGTLAGGIAHDFNNILAAIQGYIELLKMDIPPGDKVHNRLMAAEKSVIQAMELTNRLITFARGGGTYQKSQ